MVELNVLLFVPAFEPFTNHWYDGLLPPLSGVAVNVALVFAQIVVPVELIETDGVTIGLTVMVRLLDVAVF